MGPPQSLQFATAALRGELSERGLALGQVIVEQRELGAVLDHPLPLEQVEQADADYLKHVRHVLGVQAGQRVEDGGASVVESVDPVEEDRVQGSALTRRGTSPS